jgi:hypothetical protein
MAVAARREKIRVSIGADRRRGGSAPGDDKVNTRSKLAVGDGPGVTFEA